MHAQDIEGAIKVSVQCEALARTGTKCATARQNSLLARARLALHNKCAELDNTGSISRRSIIRACVAATVVNTLPANAAEKASNVSGSRVTLSLAGLSYEAATRLPKEGLDKFTERTGISINALPSWGDSTDQLAVFRKALEQHFGTPDAFVIDVIWPGVLAENLLDLTPYLTEADREQLPELLANNTVKGHLIALPFYLNIGMLYYRTDLLEKYGYRKPPDTWSELEAMAGRIQRLERGAGRTDFWGYIWQGQQYEGLTCNALEWQVSFGGGKIIERDGRITVNNPRTAEALRMATRWVGTISPPSVVGYTESDTLNLFRSGNAAFMRYWSSGYSPAQALNSPVRGRFGVTLVPKGPNGRGAVMGGFQLAVSRHSRHAREAAELVRYLAGGQIQKCRAVQDGYLPTRPPLYHDAAVLKTLPQMRALQKAGSGDWVARPSAIAGSAYAELSKAYCRTVHSVLNRQRSADEALTGLEKQLADVMSTSRGSRK